MNFPRLSFFVRIIAASLVVDKGFAEPSAGKAKVGSPTPLAASSSSPQNEPTLDLPKVTVNSSRLEDFPLMPKTELKGGGLAPSEPPVHLFFPGRAYSDSITKGYATVCIELDEKGQAIDYLLVSYTEKYFGDALMRNAKDTKYSPLLYKGVAVPSRFNFGYEFRPELTVAMNSFAAGQHRLLEVGGGRPPFKFQPAIEEELDNRLEYVRQAVPYFPDGYTPTGEKSDWVMVTLYIDETGKVRAPNVESASSPLLIRNAIKAVHYWQFKPPTIKGKPVLVYAAFAVNFRRVGIDP
jgi:hypothetical protein